MQVWDSALGALWALCSATSSSPCVSPSCKHTLQQCNAMHAPFLQYPDADILTSSDHLSNTVTDEGLELWPQAASAANIGIMLFRPRANALAKVSSGAWWTAYSESVGCLG